MKTIEDRLKKTGVNIFYTTSSEQEIFETALQEMWKIENTNRVIFSRGSRMRDLDGMRDEISASWQFPYYFGNNPPAIVDCLSDLSWLPATSYSFIIYHAHLMLVDEPKVEFDGFLRDIIEVSRRWREDMGGFVASGQQTTDFFVVFQVSPEGRPAFLNRLTQAGLNSARIREVDLGLSANDGG